MSYFSMLLFPVASCSVLDAFSLMLTPYLPCLGDKGGARLWPQSWTSRGKEVEPTETVA